MLEFGLREVEVEVDPTLELRSREIDWDGVVQATRLTSDLALTRSSSGGRRAVKRLWRLPLKIFWKKNNKHELIFLACWRLIYVFSSYIHSLKRRSQFVASAAVGALMRAAIYGKVQLVKPFEAW